MRLWVFILCIIALLLIINSTGHAATTGQSEATKRQIELAFKQLQHPVLQSKFTKIKVRYNEVPDYHNMGIQCYPEHNAVVIHFGDEVILHAQMDPHVIKATLAHELGHCYAYSDNHQQREFLADEYGLKLYLASGGTKQQFIQRFKDRDAPGGDTHPSDAERLRRLK